MGRDSEADELDLRAYLHVVRRRRRLVIAVTGSVAAVGLMASLLQRPVYRAATEVLLQSRTSQTIIDQSRQQQNAQYLQQQVQTEIQVMRSRSVTGVVERKLGFLPDVSVAAKGDTQVVVISARDTDRTRAVREADVYAATYVDVRRASTIGDLLDAATKIRTQISGIDLSVAGLDARLAAVDGQIATSPAAGDRLRLQAVRQRLQAEVAPQRQSLLDRRSAYAQQLDQLQLAANLSQSGGAQIVSQAIRPTSPVSPRPLRDGLLALAAGLLLGLGLAFLVDHLDDSLQTKDDLDEATGGLAVLGMVPAIESWSDHRAARLVSVVEPRSSAAEAYRGVRTSLHFSGLGRSVKVVQLTSPSAGEGKTTTVANLGVALARAGQRVALVDCDLRRPRLHEFFGLDSSVGFTSVILGEVAPLEALQPVEAVPRLSLLASGPPPPNPSELLSIRASRDLLEAVAEHVDYVLVDSPPLLPVADAAILAGYADATVLVATAGTTTRRTTARSIEVLRQVAAPLAGVVFNGVHGEGGYGYGYAYDYSAPSGSPRRWPRLRRRPRRRLGAVDGVPLPGAEERTPEADPQRVATRAGVSS